MDINLEINRIATLFGLSSEYPSQCELSIPDQGEMFDEAVNCELFSADNLDALAYLYAKQAVKVDFIYIDPPYNTKNRFIYDDTRVSKKIGPFGSHSSWMSFMLPRLVMANALLAQDGFIAISIDDSEQPYIRLLLDQIFGEDNFVGNIVVCRSKNGKGSKKGIAVNHDYVVVYSKSKESVLLGAIDEGVGYDRQDEYGSYKIDGLFRKKGDSSRRQDRPNMFYPLYYDEYGQVFAENIENKLKAVFPIDSQGVERRWLWGKEKVALEAWKLYASPKGVVYVKNYSSTGKRVKVRSLWSDNKYLTERATNQIKMIYGAKLFETPKPIELIEDLIISHTKKDSLIMDFFAGTGTTAHAVHNLNIVDGGTRRTILVEQAVAVPSEHQAFNYGYRKISDLTVRRLQYISSLDHMFKFKIHDLSI